MKKINKCHDAAAADDDDEKIRSRRTMLEFPKDDDFRHKISTKVDCFQRINDDYSDEYCQTVRNP